MTTPIGSVGSTAASSAATSASTARTTGGELGKDDFLKLLVAQLKYQDPSSPADSSQFMAQTAQFTMVEKLTDLDTVQQNLLTAQLQLRAGNLVGRTVGYTDANGLEQTGLVSSASFTGSNPTVRIGNTDVPLSSVKDVRTA